MVVIIVQCGRCTVRVDLISRALVKIAGRRIMGNGDDLDGFLISNNEPLLDCLLYAFSRFHIISVIIFVAIIVCVTLCASFALTRPLFYR